MHDAEYKIRSLPGSDLWAALTCEAERAQKEGFAGVAGRQRALATHIRNAERKMVELCPEGYRVDMDLVFHFVPDVNPVYRGE